MRWELTLGYETMPLSANMRLHWGAQHRIRTELQTRVGWLLKSHKVPAMDHAAIWLEWVPATKRRRDHGNEAPTVKAIVDAIVRAGVLEDDDHEHVDLPQMVIREPDKTNPRLLLVIDNNYTEGTQ